MDRGRWERPAGPVLYLQCQDHAVSWDDAMGQLFLGGPGALLLLRRWLRARFQHLGPAVPDQSHLRIRRHLRVGLGGRDPESDDEDDVRRYGLLFDAPDERHAVPDPHDQI